jgi:UDP-GlcNAc:undecaprenyl-phosphate/decaprenyl-phosphate GlcNAc-1-phosphate transferase
MVTLLSLVLAFLLASVVVLVLTPFAIELARRIRLYDMPNGRKVHIRPTPLLGGLSVFVATLGIVLIIGALSEAPLNLSRIGFFAGAVWMFLLGLADDRFKLSVPVKLAGQFVGAAFLVFTGNTDGLIGTHPIALALCLVWTVGIVNAVNFLDGLDGLAAGTTLLASVAFAIVGVLGGQPYPALIAAAAGGAALGFLRWNWNPARVFLGDAGSLFLGYVLAALGLMSTWDRSSPAYLLVPIIVLGVPIFDITFVVAIRTLEGRAITTPGRDHTLHRILRLLRSVPSATFTFLAATTLLGGTAIALTLAAQPALMIVGAGSVAVSFALLGRRLSRVSAG